MEKKYLKRLTALFFTIGIFIFPQFFLMATELKSCSQEKNKFEGKCFQRSNFDNGIYVGTFEKNKFNGIGEFFYLSGDSYFGDWKNNKRDGIGEATYATNGIRYLGEWEKDFPNGLGKIWFSNGSSYYGYWKNGKFDGKGIYTNFDGRPLNGIWKSGVLYEVNSVSLPNFQNDFLSSFGKKRENFAQLKNSIESTNIVLNEEFKRSSDVKNGLKIEIATSDINENGIFKITVQANSDIASLKINGEEQGGRSDGKYSIDKVARAGQETIFNITAIDINGNTETKTITVNRPITESQAKFASLNPAQVKKQPERDAVAIVIGIADYKNLPRADFANDDASMFYDYAIRALGIKPENIKLLVDGNADDVAIYQAFKTWLPSRVRSTTDVYVYYSGHGLPAEDGKGLYLLPQRAHRDLIEKTAISQREINGFIQAAKPKSVTIFLDSCYSGLARTGETLLASARPVALKTDKKMFPDEFTVITASQADQISSSSPDLKHGIFSYYLMRGMEGEADANRDGKITVGEMHGYLLEKVNRQAGMMNRRQEPQLIGDANRVLIAK